MSNIENLREGSQERELLGHPIGLSILFLTEMWERFSYYGMRAILILFLTKYYLFSTGKASMIYGAYVGLVYMLPIIGGYIADRYLGPRKAVTYGGILLVLGHLALAIEGPPAYMDGEMVARDEVYQSLFFFSLALIITGVGFLKANISTIVGSLYGPRDPRRDGGFTIFYMGINVGSVTSIAAVGYVGETYGWNYGFGMAGIGMLLGLVVFLWGQKFLDGRAEPPNPSELKEEAFAFINKEHAIYLLGFAMVIVSWMLIQYQEVVGQVLGLSGILMVGVLLAYGYMKCTPVERDRLYVATFLIVVQSIFWAMFELQGGSLTLLADQQFDLTFLGVTFLASQVQFFNPLFIVVFAPILAWFWVFLNRKGLEPSTPNKFGISLAMMGLGFLIFSYGLGLDVGSNKNMLWMVFIYFTMTIAELCLSPVGLSMVTKLSVPRIVGMVMGTFFLFIAMGSYVAGVIGSLSGTGGHENKGSDMIDVAVTMDLFNFIGVISLGAGIFIFIVSPILKKRMHGIH
ncbi:MAG: peptide MFS transporter [Sphingomonadales bacterium]